jgi:hypothetical protein
VPNYVVPAETLTLRQLNRATLARQLLIAREKTTAADAVERLAGMQAQEPKHPYIGLWTRLDGFRREELRTALHDREIVRVTLYRGTLHLTRARDYPAQRAVLVPLLQQAVKVLGSRADGLDIDRVLPAARDLLAGNPRTFNDIRKLLVEAFPKVNDRALGYTTRMYVPLVMIPTDDRWGFPAVAKFGLAEEWLGRPVTGDSAMEPIVRQYLSAFGPATPADAQAWAGVSLKAAFEDLRPTLRVFRDERGRELFDLPDAPRPDGDTPVPARFLPEFDNLILAYANRTRLIDDDHRPLVTTKNLRVRATFLWDGRVSGTWEIDRKKTSATLRLKPFAPLPKKAVGELTEEGERLVRFVEDDATTFAVEA